VAGSEVVLHTIWKGRGNSVQEQVAITHPES
jgi:hypothetical protein